jgi:hypothetical protein
VGREERGGGWPDGAGKVEEEEIHVWEIIPPYIPPTLEGWVRSQLYMGLYMGYTLAIWATHTYGLYMGYTLTVILTMVHFG